MDDNFNHYIRNKLTPPVGGVALTPAQAAVAFLDIINAVYCIQNCLVGLIPLEGFMHRDLHCGNIMYRVEGAIERFYLIDFGMSILYNRNITINGDLYTPHPLNGSHDMRFLLSSIIQAVGFRIWDLIRNYARNIAKRFSWGIFTNVYNFVGGTIFHGMYQDVVNVIDWRFDAILQPDMFQDFIDIPGETPTPTPAQIAALPVNTANLLLTFVKRYYV